MSELASALQEYLALRRALCYKLERTGQILSDFVDHLDAVAITHVSIEVAVAWAVQTPNPESSWRAGRLSAVRGFARYLNALDPRHQVPPSGLIPHRGRRPNPYVFSEADIDALIAATRTIRSWFRAITMEALIGLLAVSGLRVGEAVRLRRDDVDFDTGVLRVRDTKGGKSRDVPLHATTLDALVAYCSQRDGFFPTAETLFVSTTGTRLSTGGLGQLFAEVAGEAGLHPAPGGGRPRLGGLRHSFAVRTLLGFYNSGADIGAMLPVLSTYLGHVNPASTYWYLSAVPELLAAAAQRAESTLGALS